MRNRSFFPCLICGLAVGLAALAPPAARGDVMLSAGYDLFTTDPTGTFVTLGSTTVPLEGVPLGTVNGVNLYNTDTIVQRTGPTQTIGTGGVATFDLQLYALHLMSVAPVDIGGNFYNVDVKGGAYFGVTEATALSGITITNTTGTGGTFTSTLPVTAELIFTPIGSAPAIPTMSDTLSFTGTGIWQATPYASDAHGGSFTSGGFYAGPTTEAAQLAAHHVDPASTPEPSTWIAWVMVGLVAPVYARWRRRA